MILNESIWKQKAKNGEIYAMYHLGDSYCEVEKCALAEEYYQLAIDSGDPDAIENLSLRLDSCCCDVVAKIAERHFLLESEKGNSQASFQLASFYEFHKIRDDDTTKEEHYYLKSIAQDATNCKALLHLGRVYQEQNQCVKSKMYFNMILDDEKCTDFDIMFYLAELNKNNNPDFVQRCYRSLIDNVSPDKLENLGYRFTLLELYQLAEESYLKGIAEQPPVTTGGGSGRSNNCYYYVALLNRNNLHDIQKAKKYFQLAIEHTDCTKPMIALAEIHEIEKDYTSAEKYYLLAVEKQNNVSAVDQRRAFEASVKLAQLYKWQGNATLAKKHYLQALDIGYAHQYIMTKLGYFYTSKEQYTLAEKYLTKVNKSHNYSDPESLRQLAKLYCATDRNELAEALYLSAIECDKNCYGRIELDLAHFYKKQKNLELAEKFHQLAIDKANDDIKNNTMVDGTTFPDRHAMWLKDKIDDDNDSVTSTASTSSCCSVLEFEQTLLEVQDELNCFL